MHLSDLECCQYFASSSCINNRLHQHSNLILLNQTNVAQWKGWNQGFDWLDRKNLNAFAWGRSHLYSWASNIHQIPVLLPYKYMHTYINTTLIKFLKQTGWVWEQPCFKLQNMNKWVYIFYPCKLIKAAVWKKKKKKHKHKNAVA